MSERIFNFDPARYADQFVREGYVHIRGGVTEAFYAKAVQQVEQSLKTKLMKEFAIGDKQQAMYEFPADGADYPGEVCETIGNLVGVDPQEMVLSERHVKAYEPNAAPEPLAHKDRFASEFSVGLSIHVREGSTLVLYPYDETDINPFNTSVQLRASLSPDRYPEPALALARRVEIKDSARDLIVFRGHRFWHLRNNPANTTMLYLKMNSFHCDPLGEDRRSDEFRKRTLAAVEVGDDELERAVPRIGRRVDHFHRFYNRNWQEVPGVVLWGEKHFTVDQDEFRMLQAIDGEKNVAAILRTACQNGSRSANLNKIRRLARRGVLDLLAAPVARKESCGCQGSSASGKATPVAAGV